MIRKLILAIGKFFIREKSTSNSLSDEYYKHEIEKKEKNLQLFHKIVGDNPMKHIDWIIEHGYEEFNKWFKSYEDGSIGSPLMSNASLNLSLTSQNRAKEFQSNIGMEIDFIPSSREQKESDMMLRQALNARDCRLYSPANQIKETVSEKNYYKIETTLRGGLGGGVILSQRVKYRYQ